MLENGNDKKKWNDSYDSFGRITEETCIRRRFIVSLIMHGTLKQTEKLFVFAKNILKYNVRK